MAALREADRDRTQAVVLTGSGEYYSAGVNLGGTLRVQHPRVLHGLIVEQNQALFDAFLDLDKPIIAAVNGPAIGAPVTSSTLLMPSSPLRLPPSYAILAAGIRGLFERHVRPTHGGAGGPAHAGTGGMAPDRGRGRGGLTRERGGPRRGPARARADDGERAHRRRSNLPRWLLEGGTQGGQRPGVRGARHGLSQRALPQRTDALPLVEEEASARGHVRRTLGHLALWRLLL